MMKTLRCLVVASTWLVLFTTLGWAQHAIYDRATGIVHINSGFSDLVAVFIEGPDVSTPLAGCSLCDGMNLPGTDALSDASTWTVGFINGSTQWIRTNPLQGRGFVGVMADYYVDGNGMTQAWPDDFPPFLDFPDVGGGIADYSNAGSPCGGLVTFASDDGSTSTSILSCIPEPVFTPWMFVMIGICLRLGR